MSRVDFIQRRALLFVEAPPSLGIHAEQRQQQRPLIVGQVLSAALQQPAGPARVED